MTIREQILAKSLLFQDVDALGPDGAAKELTELSSLNSSLNKQIAESLFALNLKKLELLKEHGTVAKAKVYAEATEEWKKWKEMQLQKEAADELVASAKYYLRNSQSEKTKGQYY